MKFGEHLLVQAIPEWREKHIDYEGLKTILYARMNPEDRQREDIFFKKCAQELKKIDVFYCQRVADCRKRCQALEGQTNRSAVDEGVRLKDVARPIGRLRSACRRLGNALRRPFRKRPGHAPSVDDEHERQLTPEKERELKSASEEFYFELECLKKFHDDNAEGFRKILKKHDKLWKSNLGDEWRLQNVDKATFVTEKDVDTLRQRVEKFRTLLEHGDRKKAMEKLRVPAPSELRRPKLIFWSGFCWAIFFMASVISVLCAAYTPMWRQPPWIIIRLYRGFFLIILLITLSAFSMRFWERNHVNYVLIFELDPRRHLTSENVFTIAGGLWAIWSLGLLGYIVSPWLNTPRLCFPLAVTAAVIVLFINPFNCCFLKSRIWLLRRLWSCFTAPFRHGTFADFWVGNQLSALSTAFVDTQFLICFYATGVQYSNGWLYFKVTNTTTTTSTNQTDFVYDSVWGTNPAKGDGFCSSDDYGIRVAVALIPALIRLFQCLRRYRDSKLGFPHLFNAGKYATYLPVAIFGALYKWTSDSAPWSRKSATSAHYFHFWMIAAAISSCYAVYWDIRVDWRLLPKHPGKRPFLREKLLFRYTWLYYVSAVMDALVRLRWTAQVSLRHSRWTAAQNEIVTTALAVAECFRRFVWGLFRLENEQLNNVEHLRVTRRTFGVPFKKLDEFGNMMKQPMLETTEEVTICKLKKKMKPNQKSLTIDSEK